MAKAGFGFSGVGGAGGGAGSGSLLVEVTVSASDVTNGYITVPTIVLSSTKTKLIRSGANQEKSMYTVNTPAVGEITIPNLSEGEVIQIYN